MERQELICKILKERYGISNSINTETNLIEEFGFESIAFVELAAALGDETGVRIAPIHAAKWTTVQSVLETMSAVEEAAAGN